MEHEILQLALAGFLKTTGFNLKIVKLKGDNHGDAVLQFAQKGHKADFVVAVKKRLTNDKLPSLRKFLEEAVCPLLVSDYIPMPLKSYFREQGICYLDAAGNAYLDDGKGLFLFVETNKNHTVEDRKSGRAFSKAGLKVVFQILKNEDVVNEPYRNISAKAGVSIDTVGKVIKELLQDKYLVKVSTKEYKIYDYSRLLQEWVVLFNKVLRPKLRQRKFSLVDAGVSGIVDSGLKDSLGGELGAELLTTYLTAESSLVYTNRSFVDVAKELGLRPYKKGEVTLIEKFWQDDDRVGESTVHPLLVYADLLDIPTPRNLEAANIIYQEHVEDNL
ncbi:type IV toxin-antitoxin system AbiEi family antitoxin [Neolewinella persica]|uniref:type IV toxin-antitoxin system AbiEi family antitoxin n=1 Tax=Neolewinella persica TaxID=70998 RepID=UPI000361F4A5|nr:type IV toxin-antitoxin system AbiEi family antitoxin [Neolewinella persica]